MQTLGDLESEIQNQLHKNKRSIKQELFKLRKEIEVKDKFMLDRKIKLQVT